MHEIKQPEDVFGDRRGRKIPLGSKKAYLDNVLIWTVGIFALFVPGNVCVYSALCTTPPTFPLTPAVCVCACACVCARRLMLPRLSAGL